MSQIQQIQDALLSAYPSRSPLAMMLRFEMNESLDEIVGNANQTDTVFELLTWAEARGRLGELIAAAKRDNPSNPKLRALSGRATQASTSQPSKEVTQQPSPAPSPDDGTESRDDGGNGYDVFISYNHKDGDWVRTILLPTLEEAGLRVCIDYRDFELGLSALLNMEEAVEKSRHTLLVLTPNWIGSEWTAYESILTQTADPIGLRRRTIPLLREQCELPSRIAMLTYADFTGPDHALPWDRLVRALQR